MKIFTLVILSCIAILTCVKPFGSDDHDYVAYKIINLSNKLEKKSLSELQSYALSLEKYNSNGKIILGGIHDYITKLPSQEIKKYILTVCLKRKELLEEDKFESIVQSGNQKIQIFLAKEESQKSEFMTPKKLGGLHDYIYRVDNDTLIRWALTCQAHDNKITSQKNEMDVNKKSVKELIDYILSMAEKYPGLDSSTELDRLGKEYSIKTKPFSFGGIHDYLYRQTRPTLIKWALTAEAHYKKVENINVLGGLHDYIGTLSDVEIANYILEKAQKYEDINSGDKLDALSVEYKIEYKEKPHITPFGGLHDYIFRQDRQTLIRWALTCEYHDRYERKIDVRGGLHDYIKTLSNEKIAEYILGVVAVYPVLNNSQNLDSFAQKYNIKYEGDDKSNLKFLQ